VTKALDATLACDIMMDLEGSIRPAMYLASELIARGHDVTMMSPMMSEDVEERLHESGITPINLRAKLTARSSGLSLLWFETWVREAFLKLNSRHVHNDSAVMINFSQVVSVPSLAWYLQGPPSIALRDMEKELSTSFRIAYNFLKPVIGYADKRLVSHLGRVSSLVIANSKFCASMYSEFGVKVDDIIYPPIDRQTFRPSTSDPSSNYVLTYFGKETKFSVIERIADMGVKIRAFGSKTPFIRRNLIEHPNITHEPFGYVPLESMACGTPVLTSNVQGPSEYVIHNSTGWLMNTDEESVRKALELWKGGYPSRIRLNCIKVASKFDKKVYIQKWIRILSDFGACSS